MVDVFITPAGLGLAERVQDEIRRALEPATGRLGPGQRARLGELLELTLTPALTAARRPPAAGR